MLKANNKDIRTIIILFYYNIEDTTLLLILKVFDAPLKCLCYWLHIVVAHWEGTHKFPEIIYFAPQ